MTGSGDDGHRVSEDSGATVPLEQLPLHSTNLLTVLDEDATIRYESPSIERVFGYEQRTLIGDALIHYIHPEDRERVMAAFHTIVDRDGDTVETVEFRHRKADDTYTWVESTGSANPTPNGNRRYSARINASSSSRASSATICAIR
ncbi:PAS domain-containing protein [Natrarchaeobius halalkaliphilus]|uniref:PAS domain-containing protein n=1 Tax=Natrarchaeobius halalkaliphilus TaxID=1679091 RepID=UPI001FB2DB21|nr:PAS domain-containing protein [Natrarchaeobius halalkaliphilus]